MTEFTPSDIAALIIAASFAAGLNVYATVLTLGVLARLHLVVLPPGLEELGHTWVIAISGVLFALEFVADKIPGVDLIWNALHTFVRLPVAALLAWQASAHMSPEIQILSAIVGAGIALITHSSKIAARAAVTPSPEPVSNIALSTGEDVIVVGITWLATRHPWTAAGIAIACVAIALLMIRWIAGAVRKAWAKRAPSTRLHRSDTP
jgi:Domain of unknown function (DUF4126)